MHLNLCRCEYICIRRSSVPVRTAPSVIPSSSHTAPSRQTAKIIYGKCDSGISGTNLNEIYIASFLVLGTENAVQRADGDSTEPVSSSTVCLIQRDFSRVEVAVLGVFFKSRELLGWKLSYQKVKKTEVDWFCAKETCLVFAVNQHIHLLLFSVWD